MEKYIKRISEKIIEEFNKEIKCAILITGPKWCGKSFLARQYANYELDVSNLKHMSKDIVESKISDVIDKHQIPILIDEWQEAPMIWDVTKKIIDKTTKKGINLLLTGSSTPAYKNKITHSGVGRIFKIWLSTLTFDEINHLEKKLSFTKLFECKNNQEIREHIKEVPLLENNYNSCLERIAYGCWPEVVVNEIKSSKYAERYAKDLSETNFREVNGLIPNKKLSTLILKAMARLNATTMELSKIQRDLGNENISRNTLDKYWEAFNSISLLIEVDSFSLNARSKTQLRLKPKVYFCDPSIVASILNLKTPDALMQDYKTLGFLFENLVMKDLMVYAQAFGGTLYYFRNNNNLEVDAIIQYNNRQWGAIEIKLGSDNIDKAAKNLLNFKEKFEVKDNTIESKPSFLMVISAAVSIAYMRDDGVIVCPPTVLGV